MPAAGSGDGLVRRRGKKWTAYWWVDRVQHSKGGFPTRAAAIDYKNAMMEAVREGTYVEPTAMLLSAWLLDEWLPTVRGQLKAGTWAGYRDEVVNHIIPHLGKHEVLKLKRRHVRRWIADTLASGRIGGGVPWRPIYQEMRAELGQTGPGRPAVGREPAAVTQERAKAEAARRSVPGSLGGVSRSSARTYVVILHKALEDCMEWGEIGLRRNVADKFTRNLRPERKPKKVWTPAQVRAFLTHRKEAGDRLYALWATDLGTGMRRGEVLGLRWDEDVFLDEEVPYLRVEQTSIVVDREVVTSTPKTESSYRTVTIDAETAAVLRAHREVQELERMMAGEAWEEHGLVFCREDGRSYHPDAISDAFLRAGAAARMPRIPFRNMRHTHATMGLTAKPPVPLKVMSQRLGHKSIAITADIYQWVIDGLDAEAADAIGALMYQQAGE
jgi:integrase